MKVPEGWPTEAMVAAGFEVTMSMAANAKHYKELVFRKMLAAAPTPDSYADKELLQIITERDQYHDWADKLADAIAERLGVEIGEHSNTNAPWQNALDAIEAPTPEVEPVAWFDGSDLKQLRERGFARDVLASLNEGARCNVPLYTHPASDELVKAAREALRVLDLLGPGPTADNLRAALDKQ